MSERMSRRLAGTSFEVSKSVHQSVRFGCVEVSKFSEARMPAKKSGQWRQLSDCVSGVLRDVRVAPGPAASGSGVERPKGFKLH